MSKTIKHSIANHLLFCFFCCSFCMSCSNKYNLTYDKISKAYIKEDTLTNLYYGYNEDLGLKIPFFKIDSIYGNKRKVWIKASLNDMKLLDNNICIYSCSRTNEKRKIYKLNKKLGCVDMTGSIRIKIRYDNDTISFISKPITTEPYKALLYQLSNISLLKK